MGALVGTRWPRLLGEALGCPKRAHRQLKRAPGPRGAPRQSWRPPPVQGPCVHRVSYSMIVRAILLYVLTTFLASLVAMSAALFLKTLMGLMDKRSKNKRLWDGLATAP